MPSGSLFYPTVDFNIEQALSEIYSRFNCAAPSGCGTPCDDAIAASFLAENPTGPAATMSPQALSIQLEQKFSACASNIKIQTPDTGDPATLPLSVLKGNVLSGPYFGQIADQIGPPEQYGNLLALIQSMSGAMVTLSNSMQQVFVQAEEQHLGYYTVEQEADEEAAESMADLGLDPNETIGMQMDFLSANPNPSTGSGEYPVLGYADCSKLLANGWKGSSGNPVFVPIGDFNDPHHSLCFRAFNLSREIQVHSLAPANGVTPPAVSGPSYSSVVAEAKAINSSLPGQSTSPANATPVIGTNATLDDDQIDHRVAEDIAPSN